MTLPDNIIEMRTTLYGAFQLKWMLEHGHTINDILEGMAAHADKDYINIDDNDEPNLEGNCIDVYAMYEDWEREDGFNGEIYPDFWEFVDNELMDKEIAMQLINELPPYKRDKTYDAYAEYYYMEKGERL